MFGYVKPMTSELKVREYELYKSIYCGLCRAMGENICYSQRFTLSYDILFLALVRIALTNESIHVEKRRCPVHPIEKRNHAFVPKALKYSSQAAAILTYFNVADDIEDSKGSKKLKYKALLPWATRFVKKANDPELTEKCREYLKELSALEKEGGSLDKNADCFGSVLGCIFARDIKEKAYNEAAYNIGFHTGRWIYIIDAADDFEKDKNKGEYNPLSAFEKRPDEFLSLAATLELESAKNALDSVEIKNKPIYEIINNILTLGMPEAQDKIFKEKRDNERPL